jgi:hypothetical protein
VLLQLFSLAQRGLLGAVMVDEAHLIDQWGGIPPRISVAGAAGEIADGDLTGSHQSGSAVRDLQPKYAGYVKSAVC